MQCSLQKTAGARKSKKQEPVKSELEIKVWRVEMEGGGIEGRREREIQSIDCTVRFNRIFNFFF